MQRFMINYLKVVHIHSFQKSSVKGLTLDPRGASSKLLLLKRQMTSDQKNADSVAC